MSHSKQLAKIILGLVPLLLVSAFLWACGSPPSKANPGNEPASIASDEMTDDEKSVDEFLDAFQERYSDRDLGGVTSLFMENGNVVVDFEGSTTIYTTENWLKMTGGAFKNHRNISDRLTEREITVYGNIAVAICRYDFDSQKEHSFGHDIFSLVRSRNGWRIVSLMYNGEMK